MTTLFWVVIIAVLAIGAAYAVYGIKFKRGPDMSHIICANSNCGYKGEPDRQKQFSYIIFVFLFLFWMLPGIVYAVLVPRYKYSCPKCQMKVSV